MAVNTRGEKDKVEAGNIKGELEAARGIEFSALFKTTISGALY